MLKIKLNGHDLRYEVFQLVSLFYNKSEIDFIKEDGVYDLESGYDVPNSLIYCKIIKHNEKPIFYSVKIDMQGPVEGSMEKSTASPNKKNKKFKNAVKLTILKCLEQSTDISMPWGILVGIRPTKIVHEGLREGSNFEGIMKVLTGDYAVSNEKACLTLEVAKNESRYLSCSEKAISLYIGIPFCPTRCSYCSFTSNSIKGKDNLVSEYLKALIYETEEMLRYLSLRDYKIDTIYMGGGTPTSLTAEQLNILFNTLQKHIDLKGLREFTVEAGRADSIDKDKLRIIKEAGCSRISINPQTMNDKTLKLIGRGHTSGEVVEKFYLAREYGFDNINMDLIIGLPGEGQAEIHNTLDILKKLAPENITIHTMAIKRASVLNEMEYKNNSIDVREMYDTTSIALRSIGLKPYYMYRQKNMVCPLENIGYCMPDRECIYNIQMIAENISIVALGADAVTKVIYRSENRIERTANVKDVKEYNSRVKEMVENKIRLFESK
jgi:coproporphyrinogen dehydrogenase HemZ